MKRHRIKRLITLASVSLSALLIQAPCQACTACYGQSDSPLAAGMNWGIFSLLGFIGLVLGGVAGFAIFLMRRAAAHVEPDPLLHQAELEGLVSRAGVPGYRNRRLRPSCREKLVEARAVAVER